MLEIKDVSRSFRIQERREGWRGIGLDLIRPRYTIRHVLDELSFTVSEGERLGIAGKNGSGKSTLLKMMCGVLEPSSGDIMYRGKSIKRGNAWYKRHIGVMFGQRSQLDFTLAFAETLSLHRHIYGMSKSQAETRRAEISELFSLQELINVPVRELSLGQRIRCEIALALFHDPKLLFLDEPTIGLDLEHKEKLHNALNALPKHTTLIIASHDVDDIKALTNRLFIINKKRIDMDIPTIDFLKNAKQPRVVHAIFSRTIPDDEAVRAIANNESTDTELVFAVPKESTLKEIIEMITHKELIHDIRIEDAGFDGVLLSYYKKD